MRSSPGSYPVQPLLAGKGHLLFVTAGYSFEPFYDELNRLRKMVQFKEKSKKSGPEEAGTGVLTYPVLMASDILLYQVRKFVQN